MTRAMLSTAPGRNKVNAATPRTTSSAPARSITTTLLALVVLAASCGSDHSSARGAADAFLDAHYVAIDLERSQAMTSGLARHKVAEEIRLTQGVEIDDTTRKPIIRYELLEERPSGDDATQLLYEASITPEGVDTFQRRWLLTVRNESDGWRVTNYEEIAE